MPMSRRGFFHWTGSIWRPTSTVQVTRRTLPIPGLADSLDGLRLAHISDTHLPGNRAAAKDAVRHIRRVKPEIVVLTGDIVQKSEGLAAAMSFAKEVRGTLATFAVMGNWEHAAGLTPDRLAGAYAESGVELLVNACRTVLVGGAPLNIVGLDDPSAGRPDPEEAVSTARPGAPTVWLVHSPGIADDLGKGGWEPPTLILSGHTHGGQIRIPGLPPLGLPRGCGRFISGYYPDAAGPLYVSRGIGTSGIRTRLFCPAELPMFTLQRA